MSDGVASRAEREADKEASSAPTSLLRAEVVIAAASPACVVASLVIAAPADTVSAGAFAVVVAAASVAVVSVGRSLLWGAGNSKGDRERQNCRKGNFSFKTSFRRLGIFKLVNTLLELG